MPEREEEFRDLNDVQKYIENLPGWRWKRGQESWLLHPGVWKHNKPTPADNYEVLQVFRPGDSYSSQPFAEFWRGYYEFSPQSYTGICGNFQCYGSLDFAMKDVINEAKRLDEIPMVIAAVKKAVWNDKMLEDTYSGISCDDVRKFDDRWAVEDDVFRCTEGVRCVMHVYPEGDTQYRASYRFEKKREDGGYTTVYENEMVV